MDPITANIIANLATNYFTAFTAPVVGRFFTEVFRKNPALEEELQRAKTHQDFERVFREAVGVIDAAAATGEINIDSTFLSALRGIRFDHQNGTVTILGSKISAPILQMGGSFGASGVTHISGSTLKSQGAEIRVGQGASIRISGGASIRQS
jgi:hypothetical protein